MDGPEDREIREDVWISMIEHARRESPLECCGLLTGRGRLVDAIIHCTNELGSPDAFSIPPRELFAAFRRIRESERILLGIYHSHPNGDATPSRRDFEEFHYGGVDCWIVALQEGAPVIRCFSWTARGFIEAEYALAGKGRTRP
jgi:[CysO sulfur-carrier protein]-S-L-cysteine hydrolase